MFSRKSFIAQLFVMIAMIVGASAAFANNQQFISFNGKASIEALQSGKLAQSIRLGDRSQAPYNFKVGMVLPIVNGEKAEDARTFEQQIAANAYGKTEITLLTVAQFDSLSADEKQEFLKYYSPEKIKEAKGVVTRIGLKFKK